MWWLYARWSNRPTAWGMTLHRAFDLTPDMSEALEIAIELGFQRVLTSGGALSALDATDTLAALVDAGAWPDQRHGRRRRKTRQHR